MSLYGKKHKIGGVPCGIIMRGMDNGRYQAVFEREFASLEEIEAIDWSQPVIEGDCVLPAGYGFTVDSITYDSGTRSYTVNLRVAEQFLGDVAGFQAQVDELTATVQEHAETIRVLEGQLEEADEALIAMYEAMPVGEPLPDGETGEEAEAV